MASAFDTLGLREIVSFTVPDNVRSRAVTEKLGMTRDPADDFDHPQIARGIRFAATCFIALRHRDRIATGIRSRTCPKRVSHDD